MILSPEFYKHALDGKVFYHFTTDIGLRVIKGEDPAAIVDDLGSIPPKDKAALLKELKRLAKNGPGLHPANYFVQGPRILSRLTLPRKGRKKVVEGLLEPAPESWTNTRDLPVKGQSFYEFFIDTLTSGGANIVKKYAKEYTLLKVSIQPEDDIKIADIADLVKDATPALQGEAKNRREKVALGFHAVAGVVSGTKKYWKSLVPVSEYKGKETPTLPVVVCWTSIAPERLEVVQTFSTQQMQQLKNLHWKPRAKSPSL